jgi:DegV family protein with EDD domain
MGGLIMSTYKIYADSCSDLSTASRRKLDVEYCRMNIIVDGNEIPADLDWKEYTVEEFYGWLYAGRKIKTNQVPLVEYLEKFELALKEGKDVLYLCASSALSGSINTAIMARGELLEKYPDRKIICIDSLCACYGQGSMAIDAAKMKNEGKNIDEVASYLEENKLCYHQFATVESLEYLRKAGRVKATSAFFGNLLGVKPMIISDAKGNNFAVKKVKGRKNSLNELINMMKENVVDIENQTVYVAHADALEDANYVKELIIKEFNPKEVKVEYLGPIIGVSVGPGTIGVYAKGKKVEVVGG